jgi:cytochrome P450
MAYQLSLHPDQRRRLVAEPALIPNAVEEVLRYESSTHLMARTLTRDVRLHGRTMEKGKKVALLLAAANRDGRYWKDPDVFDVGRDTSGHVAFGVGVHHCLGASLARLEATVALQEILARIPDFQVDERGLERVHSGNVRGFRKVPITFTPPG